MLDFSGSQICSHTGTCSSPNLDKNEEQVINCTQTTSNQIHEPKQTLICMFPKLGTGRCSQGSSSFSGAGNTELPSPTVPAFSTRLRSKGLCSRLLHSTTGTWKWALPCNGVEKAIPGSSRKQIKQCWAGVRRQVVPHEWCFPPPRYKMQQLLHNESEVFH